MGAPPAPVSTARQRPSSAQLRTPDSWTRLTSRSHFFPWLEPNAETYEDGERGLRLAWSSRAHRKGIPALPLPDAGDAEGGAMGKPWTVKRRPMRFVGFDWWDISWWVATLFTVGSVFWCINGTLFFVYFSRTTLPYTNTEAATAFLGGTLFIVGAYLGWVESMNPARDAEFGWEVDLATKTLIEPHSDHRALGRHRHHFGQHRPFTSSRKADIPAKTQLAVRTPSTSSSSTISPGASPWKWYGTYPSLAYTANTVQLFGATIFWVSTMCGLPGVLPLSGSSGGPRQQGRTEGLWVGLYWACQVIGSPCFVFAGACFCIEVQDKWWKPKPTSIGWQIGFWNLIGGFGFWFCGIFGIWRQTSIQNPELYQRWGSAFSTFWGSWAFLIGSYIQLFEGINKRS